MKRILLCFLAITFCAVIFAQDEESEFRTLFDYEDFRISGFGGPMMSFTTISGEFAHMMGGGGAVLLGNFFIGGYGLGLTTDIRDKNDPDNVDRKIDFGHGGFWTGVIIKGKSAIHPSIHSTIGWGSVSINDNFFDGDIEKDGVFVLTPTLELEMNLTQFFRVSVGASYRIVTFVDDLEAYDYKNDDFSGPSAFVSLKFGWF